MTRAKLHEGPCSHAGHLLYVASRGTTVPLQELSVRLNGYGIEPAAGATVDAVLSLTVTNRLSSRMAFDAHGDATVLELGPRTFAENVAAERAPGISFVWRNAGIDPGRSQTGTVVFRIPRRDAGRLATLGSLAVVQFSDAGRRAPRGRIAILRTYASHHS